MADSTALSPAPGVTGLNVPWPRVETFVGKLAHDIRNGFNALELQVTLIGELTEDPEIKEEIKRVRQSLAGLTRQLQAVRVATGEPSTHLFPYPTGDFLEDLRERFQKRQEGAAARVQWVSETIGGESINIDPEQTINALLELLDNAWQHAAEGSSLRVEASQKPGALGLVIHQQLAGDLPSLPTDWGRTPLLSTRRNAYGLGAFRARRILEAQGASLEYSYTAVDQALVTTVILPTADPSPAHD